MKVRVGSLKLTRTATGFHHRTNRIRCAIVLLLFAAACAPRIPLEERYRRAVLTFQQGELAPALTEARAGAGASPSRSLLFHKFRLLEAEILIYQGKTQSAAAILADNVPDAPEFAGLNARLKMLRSYVLPAKSAEEKGRLLDDAWSQATRLGDAGMIVDIELQQGILKSRTDPETARSLFERARQRAR